MYSQVAIVYTFMSQTEGNLDTKKTLEKIAHALKYMIIIHICYSPAGRSVLGKTVPEVSSMARGHRFRAVLETEGTVFPNTDRFFSIVFLNSFSNLLKIEFRNK